MEKKLNMEAKDSLCQAELKMRFLTWVLPSNELMGSDQQEGLVFILQDVHDAMKEALECDFYEGLTEERLIKLA